MSCKRMHDWHVRIPATVAQKTVVFLGNSHLSALKLAHDDLWREPSVAMKFFCGRGADLFHTEVADGKIKPSSKGKMSARQLLHFYGIEAWPKQYAERGLPLGDVAAQFIMTAGEPEIDLTDVAAIFYVIGMSPYDFLRMGKETIHLGRSERYDLLGCMLGDDFCLYRQICDIKRMAPSCRHYFIGRPLAIWYDVAGIVFHKEEIVESRAAIRSMARDLAFHDIFMPSEDLLIDILLSTKEEFRIGGRQESELFQGTVAVGSDVVHMNRIYGSIVFRNFVLPLV